VEKKQIIASSVADGWDVMLLFLSDVVFENI